jgi:hypothetical protein
MIPAILHQTWKTRTPPSEWRGFVDTFAAHNPEFEHRVWSDEDARRLVREERPDLLALYDGYPYAILRADLFRYLVLWSIGGVYCDMDVAFLAPLAPLIGRSRVLLASEPRVHSRSHGRDSLVCNAFMASEPRHPLWEHVLAELALRGPRCTTHREVLDVTGPLMLQRVLDRGVADAAGHGRPFDGVEILPPETINPLSNAQLLAIRSAGIVDAAEATRLRAQGCVALHVWSNSWVKSLAGELRNPHPAAIEGFAFFRGVDSGGHDVENLGRDIPEVARSVRGMPEALAFNTDGFVKQRLRSPWRWYRMAGASDAEGLYVKLEHVRRWWVLFRRQTGPSRR